jgi:hypothetical protein
MNDSPKIVVLVFGSNVDFVLPTKLLCAHSAWFAAMISNPTINGTIEFRLGDADVLETVLVFMCTGVLRKSNHMRQQVHAALEMAIVAFNLGMEDLEWCAVGKLEENLTVKTGSTLPPDEIKRVLRSTGSTSHLREWLADHIASRLTTGTINAASLAGLTTAEPVFATMIMMSMQTTAIELLKVLMVADVRSIERARAEVMARSGGNETEEDEEEPREEAEMVHGEDSDEKMEDWAQSEDGLEDDGDGSISDEDSEL